MIQHVSLEMRADEVEAGVAFWRLLGFEPVAAPGTLGERSTWVQRGRFQVHLMHREDPVAPPDAHLALHVEDYAEAVARLREAGFDPSPREQHWGAERAFVRAPGGHRVELMAAPPA